MRIKEYMDVDWVRYLMYILIACILVILFIFIYNRFNGGEETFAITTDVQPTAIAIDKLFYVVGSDTISIYKKNGKRKSHRKIPLKHITCAKIVNGDLVILNKNLMCWVNPQTLELFDTMEIPSVKSTPIWFDFAHDHWWICESGGNIFCYDTEWNMLGFWHCSKDKCSVAGSWDGDYLVVSGGEKLYILHLPDDKVNVKVVKSVDVPFAGSFHIGDELWGISGDKLVLHTNKSNSA